MANVEHIKPPIPAGYQQLAVTSAAVVALTIPTGSRYAVIKVVTNSIRYRDDGTNPQTTSGMPMDANDMIELTSREQLSAFKAIAQATSGELEILYYKLS